MAFCTLCGMDEGPKLLICDGKTASGDYASMQCFSCAGVTRKPVGKWLDHSHRVESLEKPEDRRRRWISC